MNKLEENNYTENFIESFRMNNLLASKWVNFSTIQQKLFYITFSYPISFYITKNFFDRYNFIQNKKRCSLHLFILVQIFFSFFFY